MNTMELLKLTAVSMGIVFTTLFVISLMLQAFEYIFYRPALKAKEKLASELKEASANAVPAVQNTVQEITYDQLANDEEALAVALLAYALASEGINKRMHIKSIKRVG